MKKACTAGKTPLTALQAVLHYWAAWCEPCKHMDKVMSQLAAEYPQAAFMRVRTSYTVHACTHARTGACPPLYFIHVLASKKYTMPHSFRT
jgi:thiol-disulfide isomerase/thioredoxin